MRRRPMRATWHSLSPITPGLRTAPEARFFFEIRTASWANPWCARRQLRRDRCFVDFGGAFYIEAAAETTRACARFVLGEQNVTMCLNDPSLCQHLRSCALVPSPHGFGAVQVHQKSRHFVRQISRSFIERLQFLSNRGAHGAVRCYFCVRQRFVA
jgi:hypothetical protein